jgi:hypothetical protein
MILICISILYIISILLYAFYPAVLKVHRMSAQNTAPQSSNGLLHSAKTVGHTDGCETSGRGNGCGGGWASSLFDKHMKYRLDNLF